MFHEENHSDRNVTQISFSQSSISYNSPEIFKKFPNLHEILINFSGMTTLVPFENCSGLLIAGLYYNNLTKLEKGIFSDCSKLKSLNFYSNSISSIDNSAFVGLKSLNYLDLSSNSISEINKKMFEPLTSLIELCLSSNDIAYFAEDTFLNLNALKNLDLSGNQIKVIRPSQFSGLTNLKNLQLAWNNISLIHNDSFKDLTNLETLGLYANQLSHLNCFLNKNTNLISILLARNQIKSIDPLFFRNLTSLRYLEIRENICASRDFIINSFDDEFQENVAPELKRCFENSKDPSTSNICRYFNHKDLGYTCELSNVTFNDQNMDLGITGVHLNGMKDIDVKAVIFNNSSLSRIPVAVFDKFKFLDSLVANSVNLLVADESTLEVCGNLKHIDLSQNEISTISDKAFQNCSSLTSINLSSNQIKSLPAKLFNRNNNLESINFDRNKISSMNPCENAIRFDLKKLKHLSLKWNICVSNSFRHPILHLLFDEVVLRDIKICFGFWFL